MSRTSATITKQEQIAWHEFCEKHNFIPNRENAEQAANYFLNVWGVDITPQHLEAALEQLRPSLKQFEPNQKLYLDLFSALPSSEQEAFLSWRGGQGLKDSFYNGAIILQYIKAHGWPVDTAHLQLTIGQTRVAGSLEWEHVSSKRENVHLKNDDGKHFLHDAGLVKQADGSLGRSKLDYAREAREAAEKANPQPTPERQLSQSDQSWRRMRLGLLQFGNHARRDESKKFSDSLVQQGLSERQIYEHIKQLVDGWKRSEQMSNRAGYYTR
jgi:hypothetical protein